MREPTEILAAIVPLLKYFISWSTVTVYGQFLEVVGSGKKIRITHDHTKNALVVGASPYQIGTTNSWPDISQFDLHDPRSIPAAIRSACRRAGKEIPTFEIIDNILENGIPKEVLDFWAACEK